MYLCLKTNCAIEHYPTLSDVLYDSDLVDKLCRLCRFKIATNLVKHKLHFLNKRNIVSKNASSVDKDL